MATSHLIADAHLTLLGHINLRHLDNARGQLVTDGDGKLATLELGIEELILLDEVDDQLGDEPVDVSIAGPADELYACVFEAVEVGLGELRTLGNHLGTLVILHALRREVLGELEELVDEDCLQVVDLHVEFLVDLRQTLLVAQLLLTGLDGAGEQLLVDDRTGQGGRCLQGSILHVAGLVAEDGAKQLLLGRGIALALRGDLTDEDITGQHLSTDANDTVLVEVLGGFLAHVGDVGRQLFDTTLGLANLEGKLLDVDAREDIVAYNALVKHDGVLIVVTLPRHVSHEQVAAKSQLAVLGAIALGEDVTGRDALTFLADRAEVDGHVLVGATELGNTVFLERRLEADKLLFLGTVVEDADGGGVNVLDDTLAFGNDHRAAVLTDLTFDAGTDDRSLGAHERHCLTHHVGSHEGTVSIVVLEERNERCGDRSNLLRSNVHQVDFGRRHDGIVVVLTAFDDLADEGSIVAQGRVALTNDESFLFLGSEIGNSFRREIYDTVIDLAVGR